jgi:hypothetical protein
VQQLVPIIPATLEAEIVRLEVFQPRKKYMRPISTNKKLGML